MSAAMLATESVSPAHLAAPSGVRTFDMSRTPWRATANPGLWLKVVREDAARGHYLGLVRFDAGVRSGLHQHQGVATSFVVDGGLTDYHGSIGLHEAGINVRGSTHDAIAYRNTVLVSRLEGPVTYPPKSEISGVHAGSRHEAFVNPDPSVPPEINVDVDSLAPEPTGIDGVTRQTIFDYAGTGSDHRMVQLTIRAQTGFAFEAGALTEFWVRGGNLNVNGAEVAADTFIACDAGARVRVESPYGALLIAWADGAVRTDSAVDLFGFTDWS